MSINRWLILAASIVCNLCAGSAYAWSVFQSPLMSRFHWTPSDVSLAFTLSLVVLPLAMIGFGKIQDLHGPKRIILLGGLLYGGAIISTGFASSLGMLYLTYGLLGGLGLGAIYAPAIANTVKWFPDKKGLASGLIAAGLGGGAIIWAPIATLLIQTYDVSTAFKLTGSLYLFIIVAAASLVKAPPPGYSPVGWTPPVIKQSASFAINTDWKTMLHQPLFYILWLMYALGAIAGLMIMGHAASIGQENIHLTTTTAALAVSLLAIANTSGRIFWGYLSDKFGRYNSLTAIYLVISIMMLILPTITTFGWFIVIIMAVGLCFGGLLGIFPIITAEHFGIENLGMNYGIMFTAFGLAAIIGPRLAARVKELTAGYTEAFLISAALSACGIIMILLLRYRSHRQTFNQ
ncbi:MAG: major facilitator superfamily 1 [Firmicutes bacterium]|nr:major facilitator superfamily 1 [Bacillota bacterium]